MLKKCFHMRELPTLEQRKFYVFFHEYSWHRVFDIPYLTSIINNRKLNFDTDLVVIELSEEELDEYKEVKDSTFNALRQYKKNFTMTEFLKLPIINGSSSDLVGLGYSSDTNYSIQSGALFLRRTGVGAKSSLLLNFGNTDDDKSLFVLDCDGRRTKLNGVPIDDVVDISSVYFVDITDIEFLSKEKIYQIVIADTAVFYLHLDGTIHANCLRTGYAEVGRLCNMQQIFIK